MEVFRTSVPLLAPSSANHVGARGRFVMRTSMSVTIARRDLAERIRAANQGRDAELLGRKYAAMRANAFAFLRGTAHLHGEDWPVASPLDAAPLVWACGDLHLENFGTYQGDNRLTYFDMNDFDAAALAPCTLELARFLTSVLVGATTLGVRNADALGLCARFLAEYSAVLRTGKARWVERQTATGMVRDLFASLTRRTARELLVKRTDRDRGVRRLCICVDEGRALPASAEQREKVMAFMRTFAARQADPSFYAVRDVARRIAGNGSLGVERYVLLINGGGSPDGHVLLDLKRAQPSPLAAAGPWPQPVWPNEAERIVAIQQRVQAIAPAFLHAVVIDGASYVLRELQPAAARLRLDLWNGKLRRLERVLVTMAQVVASGQLRGGGRQASATADDLIAFAEREDWQGPLLAYAEEYGRRTECYWREFRNALDSGAIA